MTMNREPFDDRDKQPAGEARSLTENVRLGLGIAGSVLLLLFLVQNFEDANINLLWFEFTMPLFFALLAAAILGALASMAFGFFRRRAKEAEQKERLRMEKEKKK